MPTRLERPVDDPAGLIERKKAFWLSAEGIDWGMAFVLADRGDVDALTARADAGDREAAEALRKLRESERQDELERQRRDDENRPDYGGEMAPGIL